MRETVALAYQDKATMVALVSAMLLAAAAAALQRLALMPRMLIMALVLAVKEVLKASQDRRLCMDQVAAVVRE